MRIGAARAPAGEDFRKDVNSGAASGSVEWPDVATASTPCTAPIRWAGGKRLLAERLRGFLPTSRGTFYEPMLGSGALFFSLRPSSAILGDINRDLINFYSELRLTPLAVAAAVNQIPATKDAYYRLRASSPAGSLERAVRFYYLIRLAWNGIYRVNRLGRFNVPYGGRSPATLFRAELAVLTASALGTAILRHGDFVLTTASAAAGDLVYFDPPYPKGALDGNGFARYHETGFTLADHKRLARHASELADRGVHVLVTEAARKEILQLYSSSFHVHRIRTRSLIAARTSARRNAYEAILTSYKTP